MSYQGEAIQEPKTPGAHRVWELVSIFQQALDAWQGLADGIAAGYSSAWYRQKAVLDDIKKGILADLEFANFLLGIVIAGFSGGVMGGVMSGLYKAQIEKLLGPFVAQIANSLSGETAKRVTTKLFAASSATTAFSPVGLEPSTYGPKMQANVSVLFMMLRRVIAGIIKELESGNRPFADGDEYYKGFLKHPVISRIPDDRDIKSSDFERDATLALWIAWGGQRDFVYWNRIWRQATRPQGYNDHGNAVIERGDAKTEIERFDPILDEIRGRDWVLGTFVSGWVETKSGNVHLDIRKLKDLGSRTSSESLQALSGFFSIPMRPMTFSESLQLTLAVGDKVAGKLEKAAQNGK